MILFFQQESDENSWVSANKVNTLSGEEGFFSKQLPMRLYRDV